MFESRDGSNGLPYISLEAEPSGVRYSSEARSSSWCLADDAGPGGGKSPYRGGGGGGGAGEWRRCERLFSDASERHRPVNAAALSPAPSVSTREFTRTPGIPVRVYDRGLALQEALKQQQQAVYCRGKTDSCSTLTAHARRCAKWQLIDDTMN